MYSSDITLGEEQSMENSACASDDSTIPAWSFVRLGEILEGC
jgi:hypothetical protein